jgi:hypothetical protein
MLDFNDFFYFVQVVDRGGFTAAGRTLRGSLQAAGYDGSVSILESAGARLRAHPDQMWADRTGARN